VGTVSSLSLLLISAWQYDAKISCGMYELGRRWSVSYSFQLGHYNILWYGWEMCVVLVSLPPSILPAPSKCLFYSSMDLVNIRKLHFFVCHRKCRT
jgi:hypothetical protein